MRRLMFSMGALRIERVVVLGIIVLVPLLPIKLVAQQPPSAATELVKTLNQKLLEAKAASDANQFQKTIEVLQSAIELDATRDLIWAKLADAQSKLAAQDPAQADVMYRKSA